VARRPRFGQAAGARRTEQGAVLCGGGRGVGGNRVSGPRCLLLGIRVDGQVGWPHPRREPGVFTEEARVSVFVDTGQPARSAG